MNLNDKLWYFFKQNQNTNLFKVSIDNFLCRTELASRNLALKTKRNVKAKMKLAMEINRNVKTRFSDFKCSFEDGRINSSINTIQKTIGKRKRGKGGGGGGGKKKNLRC